MRIIHRIICLLSLISVCFGSTELYRADIVTSIKHERVSASLHLHENVDTSNHYELTIIFLSNRYCITNRTHNKTSLELPVTNNESTVISNNLKTVHAVRSEVGPDEIVVQVEGLTLQSFLPKHVGCGQYKQMVYIYDSGLYHLKVFRTRSEYQAIQEVVPIYPKIDSQ